MSKLELIPAANKDDKKGDFMRIHPHKGYVNGRVSIFKFTDKDTKQLVFFAPSLNISSYGETHEKAFEMIKDSISDLFDHFVKLSRKDLELELRNMGWKKTLFKNKEFSKMAVALDSHLENLNAYEDKVERFSLVA